jgi:putative ABC transport system permease protein
VKPYMLLLVSLRALRRNSMRSLLTAFGVVIGVAAVISTVSIGSGARYEVEEQVTRLGQNVILVFPGSISLGGISTGGGTINTLTADDAVAIQEEIPEIVAASPEVRSQRQVSYGNRNWFTRIYGQSADYLQIRQWPLESGRMFDEEDVVRARKVAVVGETIVEELFEGTDPVGETIRVSGMPLEIIGVLGRKGMSLMGSVQDDIIVVPYSTAFRYISGRSHAMVINTQVYSPELMEVAQQKITDLLRERHRLAPNQPDDFTVQTQEEVAQTATETSRIMTFLLGSIAGISLLVGGIGIMNIMLVSVTERTREIGIRIANGARNRDILRQFLVEAMLLSSLGGVLGIVLGLGVSHALASYADWPVYVSPDAMMYAFVFSAAVGIFFGFYPARKAARLDPIDALRYE